MAAGAGVIALTFGLLGAWSAMAKLDSAVVAPGSIVVENDRKVVQHLEGGIVSEILADEDRRVTEGEVLLRIASVQAKSAVATARNQLLAAQAEERRILAELDGAEMVDFGTEMTGADLSDDVKRALADQSRIFVDRRDARRNEIGILLERSAQSEQQIRGLKAQLEASRTQSASYADEMTKVRPLVDKGLVAAPRIRQIERAKMEQDGRTGQLSSDIERLERVIQEAQFQISGVRRKAREENASRLSVVRSSISDLKDKVAVVEDALRRSDVRAPKSGRIVNRKVFTVGGVVHAGETLMEIVPDDDTLVVSARVQPLDVPHLHPGQAAEVRVPALRSRSTPIALGEVRSVSADAVRDEYSRQPYFEIRISVRVDSFPPELRRKLIPGLPAEVIVATGERTVLAYLTQPLMDAMQRGMREF
ncbi:HlyD family type I secretion periplasmic adaptor subunit [Alsobacter soli]|uniref:Membrane fusion protein (MFP) family protein n=2 Tax=Alsobacter soli TaxID=2109933 RepID=A0A2T1HNA9_9HYPH|nr:HlyD family type I secretion periplasmic adaptor subunit [Alsobacter soli]